MTNQLVGFISSYKLTKDWFYPVLNRTKELIDEYSQTHEGLIVVSFYGQSAAAMGCRQKHSQTTPHVFADNNGISWTCDKLVFVGPGMTDSYMKSFNLPYVVDMNVVHPVDKMILDKPMKPPGWPNRSR